jgi:exodeoxyribonuclease V beta subunit
MKKLDPWRFVLGGSALIEASAGTGKTHTLTTLYVRLLVENDLLPSQILVVTYTQAATAELRERIRKRIQQTIAAGIAAGAADTRDERVADWEELASLAARARSMGESAGGSDPLRRALQEFDEAAIFTIHGFCQRTLQEHSFESGAAFDAELVEKNDVPQRILANDLWARLLEGEDPEFVAWLREGAGRAWQFEPDDMKRELLDALGADEEMPILPETVADGAAIDFVGLRRIKDETWHRWASVFEQRSNVVRDCLVGDNDLHGGRYKRATIEATWLPWLERSARQIANTDAKDPIDGLELPDWWAKLTPQGLEDGLKKNGRPVADPFFDVCGELAEIDQALDRAQADRALGLRQRFVEAARVEARKRREERHLLYFDDLLGELRRGLRPPDGDALVDLLRHRYPFALIDEFQDTDPVQYEIFRTVWHREERDAARGLILIGDPKQAIYSFRDADVFTYLSAHEDVAGEVFELGVNWRSDPGLIAAVNTLFERPKQAFGLSTIDFHPVAPAPEARSRLSRPGGSEAGLRVLLADRSASGDDEGETAKAAPAKKLRVRFGRTRGMEAVAKDIADLLESGATVDDEPIRPSHIAILCRRKLELAAARRALERLGIPCADRGDDDVFDSREAWELVSVLRAMQRPGDSATLRAALATGAHGFDAETLRPLSDDSSALTEIAERFAEYGRIWLRSGFARAFETWRRAEGVTARLLAYQDGERRITNWLHLAELLQRIASDRSPSRSSLVDWLEEAIARPDARGAVGSEASLLRLERDDEAVSLVTLHRSKGLEYEIVYLPSLWEKAESRMPSEKSAEDVTKQRRPIRFHDPDTKRRSLDLAGADYAAHLELHREESFSEQLRLLYVGLTRAKRQCVVVWGAIGDDYAKTPLAWLLHAPTWQAEGGDRKGSPEKLKSWDDDAWREAWEALSTTAGSGAISIETLDLGDRGRWQPAQRTLPELAYHAPTRRLGPTISTTSFSALTRDAFRESQSLSGPWVTGRDLDARDRAPVFEEVGQESEIGLLEAAPVADLAASMDEFPRGAEAGTLLHEVLEGVDFAACNEEAIRRTAEVAIRRSAFDAGLLDQIVQVVLAVARTPLRREPDLFRLADVAAGQLRPEIEFTLAATGRTRVGHFSPAALASIFAEAKPGTPIHRYRDRVARMTWRDLNGYLRGFIDAVFCDGERYYLIDYKSNHLGSRQADYRPERLVQPMIDHDYVLQYLIYTIALDRHLARRLVDYDYDRHFGGVYYLFLRGLSPAHEPDCGIFFDRPAATLVRRASALLGDEVAA